MHSPWLQLMSMCFRVELVGSNSWGSQDDEGVWVGLLGMLAEGAVDLMVCHPTLTAQRAGAALFLHPTLRSRYISQCAENVAPIGVYTQVW
jgi:hypothetical protein